MFMKDVTPLTPSSAWKETYIFNINNIRGVFGKYKAFAVCLFLIALLRAYYAQVNFHLWYICGIKKVTLKKQILPLLSFHRNHMKHTRSTPIFSHLNCWLHRLFVIFFLLWKQISKQTLPRVILIVNIIWLQYLCLKR